MTERIAQLTKEKEMLARRVKELNTTCIEKDAKIRALLQVHAEEQEELECKLQRQQQTARQRECQLKQQLLKANHSIDHLDEQHQQTKRKDDEIRLLEEEAAKAVAINSNLQQQLHEMADKLLKAESHVQQLLISQAHPSAHQQQQQEQAETIAQLEDDLQTQIQHKETLQLEVERLTASAELARLEAAATAASLGSGDSSCDSTKHREAIAQLQLDKAELIDEKNTLQNEIETYHRLLTANKGSISSLQEKASTYKETANELQQKLLEMDQTVQDERLATSKADARALELQMKVEWLVHDHDTIKTKLECSNNKNKELQARLELVHEKIQQKELELHQIQLQHENNVASLESQHRQAIAATKDGVQDLKDDLERTQKRASLQQQAYEDEVSQLQHQLIDQQGDYQSLLLRLTALEVESAAAAPSGVKSPL
eukprot:TRINITY_DN66311_c4_g1_i1.p1 TRINITY_DN66311_c4_g1~~TRINITY_DN66311_c4_g1_i1.p1  ORF type:complete len:447 (-),score=75.87 TRINITY_DN66311_c4_g1_i1:1105-2397(-)